MANDDGPLVLGIIIFTLILGSLFILARVATRTIIKPLFGWDDVLIIVTWFIILGYDSAMFIAVGRGYGKHLNDLSVDEVISAQEAEIVGQFFAVFAFPTGKAAVALLLMRLFPGRKLRWLLWTFVAANAIFFYLDGIFILIQCHPVAFQWDYSIEGGTCWDSSVVIGWGYLTGVTGAMTDLVFALVPWFCITKLKIRLREKLAVGIVLSMGLFPCACAILKIYYTSTLGAHADFTFDTVPLVLWSSAELCAVNVAACILTLRPLCLWLTGKAVEDTNGRSSKYVISKSAAGSIFKRTGLLSRRDARGTQLNSIDEDDKHIHQGNAP